MKRHLLMLLIIGLAVCASLSSSVSGESGTTDETEAPYVIAIDPGHQQKANNELEPIGPGAKEKKPKVSAGTTGVSTKKPEYVLTLEIAKKLKTELVKRGYKVVMTREKHAVNISNKARSEIANKAGADLFVRIHADGATSSKVKGFSVLYPAASNKYTKNIYEDSKSAAEALHKGMKDSMKTKSRGVVPRSDLTGFNWSRVPVALVEAGFMTNPEEDKLLSTKEYQLKIVKGIADGIDAYLKPQD